MQSKNWGDASENRRCARFARVWDVYRVTRANRVGTPCRLGVILLSTRPALTRLSSTRCTIVFSDFSVSPCHARPPRTLLITSATGVHLVPIATSTLSSRTSRSRARCFHFSQRLAVSPRVCLIAFPLALKNARLHDVPIDITRAQLPNAFGGTFVVGQFNEIAETLPGPMSKRQRVDLSGQRAQFGGGDPPCPISRLRFGRAGGDERLQQAVAVMIVRERPAMSALRYLHDFEVRDVLDTDLFDEA